MKEPKRESVIGAENRRRKPLYIPRRRSTRKARAHTNPVPPADSALRSRVETLNSAQLAPIILRTHQLKAKGLFHHEIADILAQEFHVIAPSEATISRWLREAHDAFVADIRGYCQARLFEMLAKLDALVRKWQPVAVMHSLPISRFQQVEGERIPVTDENAFAEQAKAAALVLNALKIEAQILNLDDARALTPECAESKTLNDLFTFIGEITAKQVATGHASERLNRTPQESA